LAETGEREKKRERTEVGKAKQENFSTKGGGITRVGTLVGSEEGKWEVCQTGKKTRVCKKEGKGPPKEAKSENTKVQLGIGGNQEGNKGGGGNPNWVGEVDGGTEAKEPEVQRKIRYLRGDANI